MDLAQMRALRDAKARSRREALLEDLDWMRTTGETTERVLGRLAAVGCVYASLDSLATSLRRMEFGPERQEQQAAVYAWLVPPRTTAVLPEQRPPRRTRVLVDA